MAATKVILAAAVPESPSSLARPYTRRTFRRRLNQFDQLINEVTLQHVDATPDERRQLITESVRFEDFCDSIKALFGADIRNQDIKPIYQKISANPDAEVDWSELFGYSEPVGSEKTDASVIALDVNPAAAAAAGEDINVFAVTARRRIGQAAGDRHRRDVAVAIRYVPDLDCYLTVSQRGALSVWSNRLKLQSCVEVDDKAWVTGCDYMPEIRKLAVCTERSICLLDIRANGKNQQTVVIGPLDHTPQCITRVPPSRQDNGAKPVGQKTAIRQQTSTDSQQTDAILFGDDQGYVTLLTVDIADLSGPKTNGTAPSKNATRRNRAATKSVINVEPNQMCLVPRKRKLHPNWVLQVKYIPHLSCFASCCASETASLVLDSLTALYDNRAVRSISIHKGVNAFDYCQAANVIATGGIDKILRVWHPGILASPTGKLVGHTFTIVDIVTNDADQHIVSLDTARVIRVWDIPTLVPLQVFADANDLSGERRIYTMYFDRRQEQLMTGSSVIDVWPLTRAVQDAIQVPHTHDRPITVLAYNRELHQIASGCTESTLRIWDVETGKHLLRILDAHGPNVELTVGALDASGYRLATGAADGSVKVWDFGSGQELKTKRPYGTRVIQRTAAAAGGGSGGIGNQEEGDDHVAVVGLRFCDVDGSRCIVAVGWESKVVLLSDTTKSRDLPILREFSYGDCGDVTTMTSAAADTHWQTLSSMLIPCELTCADTLVVTSSLTYLACGCSNGDVILWDVARATEGRVLRSADEATSSVESQLQDSSNNSDGRYNTGGVGGGGGGGGGGGVTTTGSSPCSSSVLAICFVVRRQTAAVVTDHIDDQSTSSDTHNNINYVDHSTGRNAEPALDQTTSYSLPTSRSERQKRRRSVVINCAPTNRPTSPNVAGSPRDDDDGATVETIVVPVLPAAAVVSGTDCSEAIEHAAVQSQSSRQRHGPQLTSAKLKHIEFGDRSAADDVLFTDEENVDEPETTIVSTKWILATSHADSTVRFRNERGEELCEISHRNSEPIRAMTTDEGGKILVTGDQKGYLALWSIAEDDIDRPCSKKFKEVVFWRAHLVKVTQLVYIDKLQVVLSASGDGSVRAWMAHGGRYIGFYGQPRQLAFEAAKSPNTATNSGFVLPYDINESPMGPLQTASARRRQLELARTRLEYPLVFDNTRWKPLVRQASPVRYGFYGRETSSSLLEESREIETFVQQQQPSKNKFFDALIKPCPFKNQLDSYTTGKMDQGAIYRALPVYRVSTPDRLKTPDFSLPKLPDTTSKMG